MNLFEALQAMEGMDFTMQDAIYLIAKVVDAMGEATMSDFMNAETYEELVKRVLD